jgi:hypothetical protein
VRKNSCFYADFAKNVPRGLNGLLKKALYRIEFGEIARGLKPVLSFLNSLWHD